MFFKFFNMGFLHSKMYQKVFSREEEEGEIDPVTQAYISYKKEVHMDTAEEEKLERLQAEREKLVGIVKENLERMP